MCDTFAPQTTLEFGRHTIRFVRVELVPETDVFAAIVVIEPGTLPTPPPDLVFGYGKQELDARRDAFEQAKSRIRSFENPAA